MRRATIPLFIVVLMCGLTACGTNDRQSGNAAPAPIDTANVQVVADYTPLAEWKPDHPYTVAPVSAEEAEKLRQQFLANFPDKPQGMTPDKYPAVVRWVDPVDLDQTVANCLTENGYPAFVPPDGGVAIGNPNDASQIGAVTSDAYRAGFHQQDFLCSAMYPPYPGLLKPLNDGQLNVMYDYYSTFLIPCMAAHNATPRTELPSRDVFIYGYLNPADPSSVLWTPQSAFTDALSGDVDKGRELTSVCPLRPPSQFLYGKVEG